MLAGQPQDLSPAIGLACLYETRNQSLQHSIPTTNVKAPTLVSREDGNSQSPYTIRRMSLVELKE